MIFSGSGSSEEGTRCPQHSFRLSLGEGPGSRKRIKPMAKDSQVEGSPAGSQTPVTTCTVTSQNKVGKYQTRRRLFHSLKTEEANDGLSEKNRLGHLALVPELLELADFQLR